MRDRPGAGTTGSSEAHPPPAVNRRPQSPLPTSLFSVAGLSPQVITETLYFLRIRSRPPVKVHEIRVVTTTAGEQRICGQLLRPGDGWFHRFCSEYGIPAGSIQFDPSCILVPWRPDGTPLDDVRTPADNALVADFIVSLVRDLNRDPGTALHCSVAGGRKTMGLFLGIAFQLFARPQDRLSHVLVRPSEMEGHRDFFYPPSRPMTYTVNGRAIRSRDIRVELAEIPVLLLRDRLREVDLESQSYTALIAQAQRELDRLALPPRLVLDSRSRSLCIEQRSIRLTPLEFAVYALFAGRRAAGCGRPGCLGCERCSLKATAFLDDAIREEILGVLEKLGVRDERMRTLPAWLKDGDERFLEVRSRLNRKIRDALGPGRWVASYQIISRRSPGALSRYLIPLDPSRIGIG